MSNGVITRKNLLRKPLIITGCSSRKALAPKLRLVEVSPVQAITEAQWSQKIAESQPEIEAAHLYKGRAFSLARKTAAELDADLLILSAGLGAVIGTTRIPSYDVTLGRGGLGAQHRCFDVYSWWESVTRGRYSVDLDSELQGRPYILVCLTRAYAPLIARQLERRKDELNFRIFGEGLGRVLSPSLMTMVFKYDNRLDQAGSPGTRSDFAQRAMRHYVSLTSDPCSDSIESDAEKIKVALGAFMRKEAPPANTLASDEAIVSRIQDLRYLNLSRSSLLRYFRDVEHVACEQNRFRRLYDRALIAKG